MGMLKETTLDENVQNWSRQIAVATTETLTCAELHDHSITTNFNDQINDITCGILTDLSQGHGHRHWKRWMMAIGVQSNQIAIGDSYGHTIDGFSMIVIDVTELG
jgi:hypothetical protein